MPRRTLDTGAVVAGVGAILLLVSLFLDWYEGMSGWTAFEVLDLVLAGLAVLALLAAAERLGYATPLGVRGRGLVVVGVAAVVIIASQLLNHPPAATGRAPQVGAWLALGSSILIAAGGLRALGRISVEVVVDREPDGDGPSTRTVEREAAAEAAAEEPKVEAELYAKERGSGPLGADDPEPFRGEPGGSEDPTRKIE